MQSGTLRVLIVGVICEWRLLPTRRDRRLAISRTTLRSSARATAGCVVLGDNDDDDDDEDDGVWSFVFMRSCEQQFAPVCEAGGSRVRPLRRRVGRRCGGDKAAKGAQGKLSPRGARFMRLGGGRVLTVCGSSSVSTTRPTP